MQKYYGRLRGVNLIPSLFLKFLKSCLAFFLYRCFLELDLLTIETGNDFTNFYSFISPLAWKHIFSFYKESQSEQS